MKSRLLIIAMIFCLPLLLIKVNTQLTAKTVEENLVYIPPQQAMQTVDLTASIPSFESGAWSTLNATQAQPDKGGLVLVYAFTPFAQPVVEVGTVVMLWPTGTGGSSISCSNMVPPNPPTSADFGQCFYQLLGPGNHHLHIYYIGNLAAGMPIRYTVTDLGSTNAAQFEYVNFDSDDTAVNLVPESGRDPARLVLVLDKSGSMGWSSHPIDMGCEVHTSPPPGCEPTRWEVLNNAVNQMLAVASAYGLPIEVDDFEGDKFGVALFDSSVAPSNRFPPVGAPEPFDTLDQTTINGFLNNLATRTPGGGTSIGGGLDSFKTDLEGGDATEFNQYILLFSDGEENSAPFVVVNPTTQEILIHPTTDGSTSGADPFNLTTVNICPFALRGDHPSAPSGTEDLQQIADIGCDGLSYSDVDISAEDNPGLLQFFLEVLNDVIVGDKLEIASVQSGVTTTSDPGEAIEHFVVSQDDVAFSVLLTWAEEFNGLSNLVLSKDGVDFPVLSTQFTSTFTMVDSSSDYLAVTLRAPYCTFDECVDPSGEWELRFLPFYEVSETFSYNLFAITDNSSLSSEFNVSQPVEGVDEPIVLEAILMESGAPISGLADGSVTAIVARPGASLGNILSAAEIEPVNNPQGDSISGAGLKVSAMLSDPDLRDEILAALEGTDIQVVTLTETDPGIFTANYEDTMAEGIYTINLFVDAQTPNNGRFTRTYALTYYIRVVVDEESTLQGTQVSSLTCDFQGGCYIIDISPVDGLGNLLGPGKATLFTIPDFDGALLEPIIDNLDGSYTIQVGYASTPTEDPTLNIYGTEIEIQLDSGSLLDQIFDWIRSNFALFILILFLIILLILLILLILYRRQATP